MSKLGFSLIEILVSITILAVMSTVGIASYRQTARNQALESDVAKIIQTLNIAKTNVNSGKKVSCLAKNLKAWQVTFSATGYILQEVCNDNSVSDYAKYNLVSKNTISGAPVIRFLPLAQGVTPGVVNIGPKVINISASGNIQ